MHRLQLILFASILRIQFVEYGINAEYVFHAIIGVTSLPHVDKVLPAVAPFGHKISLVIEHKNLQKLELSVVKRVLGVSEIVILTSEVRFQIGIGHRFALGLGGHPFAVEFQTTFHE